jgi:hypothetical protein
MPTLADLLAVPAELAWDGRTWKMRPPTQLEQALFSRWLERRAKEFAERSVDLTADAQAEYRRVAVNEAAACSFEWGSDAYVKALGTPLGTAKMFELVWRTEHPDRGDVSEDLALRFVTEKIGEAAAALTAAVEADPKVRREILRAAGLPANFLDSRPASTFNSGTRRSTKPAKKSRK